MNSPENTDPTLPIPDMPLAVGIYYSFTERHHYRDVNGEPVDLAYPDLRQPAQEMYGVYEWQQTYARRGEAALRELEAQRQQRRLQERGAAHSFRGSDMCAGGTQVTDCETATGMMQQAREKVSLLREEVSLPILEVAEGIGYHTLSPLSRVCGACALRCEVAVQTRHGILTETIRFSNVAAPSEATDPEE